MIRTFGAFKLTQTPLNYQFNVIKVGTLMTLITSMQEENHKLSKSEGAQKNLRRLSASGPKLLKNSVE